MIDHRDNRRIKVIIGIRRCGKSVLFLDIFSNYLRESCVKEDQIITMRLDELSNTRYRNPMELDKVLHQWFM
ncbi:AAA family ATPase [Xylanibacter oryzae]|uniref:AAA family ATPase n=1 Tax=Xylanibacter oryzae TaxID=185293 RepID=UPI00146FC5F3|nr:AAA family ATPase [Xylanibacter oryzae]